MRKPQSRRGGAELGLEPRTSCHPPPLWLNQTPRLLPCRPSPRLPPCLSLEPPCRTAGPSAQVSAAFSLWSPSDTTPPTRKALFPAPQHLPSPRRRPHGQWVSWSSLRAGAGVLGELRSTEDCVDVNASQSPFTEDLTGPRSWGYPGPSSQPGRQMRHGHSGGLGCSRPRRRYFCARRGSGASVGEGLRLAGPLPPTGGSLSGPLPAGGQTH